MTDNSLGSSESVNSCEGRKRPAFQNILGFICALAILFFFILMLSNHLISLLITMFQVPQNLPPRRHIYAWYHTTYIIITLTGVTVFLYFVFIVTVLVASAVFIMRKHAKEALVYLRNALQFRAPSNNGSENTILCIFQLLLAYYFFYTVYWGILTLLGSSFTLLSGRGVISTDDLFRIIQAAVYEELFFRILLIGLPLLIIVVIQFLAKKRRTMPPPRKYLLGGGLGFSAFSIIFLLLSSVNFAYAHVQGHTHSQAFLLLAPTFVAGLALGYLFIEKGIAAAIIFHFAVNYMFMLNFLSDADMVPDMVRMVFLPISTGALLLVMGLGIVAGPYYFAFYINKILGFLRRGVGEEE